MNKNNAFRHRQALLEQGRQMSGRYTSFPEGRDPMAEQAPAKWKLRTMLAILLFAGFVFLDSTDSKIFQMDSKSIKTTISENINAESVMKLMDKAKDLF